MKKMFVSHIMACCLALTFVVGVGAVPASAAGAPSANDKVFLEEENSIIEVPVIIFNNTGESIFYLYMSPSSSSSWGDDILSMTVLRHGEYFETSIVVDRSDTEWDFKIEDSEGNTVTWTEIDIGEMSASGFGIEFVTIGNDVIINLAEEDADLYGSY